MNCIDCQFHYIIKDPDPDDWFCSDDVAVICTLTPNPERDLESKYTSDHSEFRAITRSCRPFYVKKESTTPMWCPLNLGELENGETKET